MRYGRVNRYEIEMLSGKVVVPVYDTKNNLNLKKKRKFGKIQAMEIALAVKQEYERVRTSYSFFYSIFLKEGGRGGSYKNNW